MRRDSERLADIMEACASVSEYLESRSSMDFLSDNLFRDAVIRQLTIVGEAAANVSPELKARHPEIPDTAWQVAARHLPELHAQVAAILADDFPGESV
jgi:uncharacterized protein with HEPN domain